MKNKKIEYKDLKVGDHLWVFHKPTKSLILVAKSKDGGYDVCGPWECGIAEFACEIIELVNLPKTHKKTPLYYYDKKDEETWEAYYENMDIT
ncbi:MAG: hypothetical protein HRT87_04505 [Legionellales bacterium]|nr:hypothetical protein [Legionellales bacterium]